jgi:hypothetical protein
MANLDFDVLIDTSFSKINEDPDLAPDSNKFILSLINDYEDGEWRYTKFQNFIWDNIAETALSIKERNSLVNQSHSLLTAAAQNLRLTDKEKDISKGSELAEIVLYGIMRNHYSALPVVPKIFYKQNSQDNAKGADSVHIVLTEEGGFTLWFGEAKFYNSIEDVRLTPIIESVENSLKTDKLKKENSIVTNVSDIEELIAEDTLRVNIINALSPKASIDILKPKINVPILLLHECEITNSNSSINENYLQALSAHHVDRARAYFKKQIDKISDSIVQYSDITFHLVLFPVPNKDNIVEQFLANVQHYQNQ